VFYRGGQATGGRPLCVGAKKKNQVFGFVFFLSSSFGEEKVEESGVGGSIEVCVYVSSENSLKTNDAPAQESVVAAGRAKRNDRASHRTQKEVW